MIENTGYDMFRYGGNYYVSSGGYWYRGRNYGGPFVTMDVRRVPRPILTVPSDRWKHPPYAGRWDHDRGRGHDRDRHDDRDRD